MGFCESSDFSSLGVSAYDFSDYFSNVLAPPVSFTSEPDRLDHGGFSFRHLNADACLLVFMSITSRFLRVLLPFIFHIFDLAIISSVFPSAWKKVIVRRVCLIFRPIAIMSVMSKGFERLFHEQVLGHIEGSGFLSDP
jgi:hypothetical protein